MLNDLWAALFFVATFAGFVAVSGLSIYGHSSTKGSQGGGIYDHNAIGVALNSNTIILLHAGLRRLNGFTNGFAVHSSSPSSL